MSSHPDADAFMRVFLRSPPDATTRLVFADWLEETGRPWNVAWAHYIRLKAEADRHPFGRPERDELEERAAEYVPHIVAELTIPVDVFLGYPKSLLQLLPPANITVRLDGLTVPPDTFWLVPESVARENVVFPLQEQARTVLLAAAHPAERGLNQRLAFILNRDVVLVGAAVGELVSAVDRHYAEWDGERTESIFAEFMAASLPRVRTDDPVTLLADLLLGDAVRFGANRLRLDPRPDYLTLRYRVRRDWVQRDAIPRRLCRPLADHFTRLARITRELQRTGRAGGEFRFDLHGLLYTIRATVEETPAGPVVDLDIADHFEIPA